MAGAWTDSLTPLGGAFKPSEPAGPGTRSATSRSGKFLTTSTPEPTSVGRTIVPLGPVEPKSKPNKPTETKVLEKEIASSPWAQASQAIVAQYAAAEAPAAAAASGSLTPQADQSAANQALASIGLSPDTSAAQWLTGEIGQANAAAAPMNAAMAAYGAQYAAEAKPIEEAIGNVGQANDLAVATAPAQSWLSALGSHVTSNLSYYGKIPKAAAASLTKALITALRQSGGYGATTTGLETLNALGAKPGKTAAAPSTTATAGKLPTATGSAPTG